LPKPTQQKIANLVQKSHESRKRAKQLLDEAKQKVEKLIENKTKIMNNIIYAIEITNLSYSGLKILNVKIGKTTNLKATLRQYRRTSPEAQILNLWESNFHKSLSECEKGCIKLLKDTHMNVKEKHLFSPRKLYRFRRKC